MEQGDTLFVYGNYLFYDGDTQIAYLRENVRMENGQVTLFTDSLNYERIPDIGYYFDGGLIVDSLNQLSSFYGQYSPGTKLAIFNDSVRLENPNLHSIRIRFITIPNRRLQQYWDLPSLFQTAGRSILPADGTIRKLTLRCC